MAVLSAPSARGQTGWTRLSNQPPMTTPVWLLGSQLTYDSVRNVTLTVVPDYASPSTSMAIWAFDGANWARLPSQNAPAWGPHSAVFDSVRRRLVLIVSYFGGPVQMWEWDGANWNRRFPTRAPRFAYSVAFDASRGRTVAWDTSDDSTWEWDGANWIKFIAPGPTIPAGMAFDAARGGVILLTESSQTWLWNGVSWSRQNTAHAPPPHSRSAMAYDSSRQRLVLFGGSDATSHLRATWEWDGVDWVERTPASAPEARKYAGAAYDVSRWRVVLFGGEGAFGLQLSDTWEWDGNDWSYRGPETVPAPRAGHALTSDEGRQVAVLFGGSSVTGIGAAADLWEFDGARWRFRSPATGPLGRLSHAMTYDAARGVTLVSGGYYGGFMLGDFWGWDGSRWTELPSASGPSRRGAHAMAFDRSRARTVLFGGQDTYGARLGDTWDWDGAQWRQISTAVAPPPRSWHALGFDAARSQTLLFGGDTAQGLAGDTWTFDGTTWQSHVLATSPTPRRLHAMVWDAARQRVVLSGGLGATGVLSDTWEWDGRTWLPQAATQSHGPRYAHALAYDGPTGRVLAFAGNDGSQRLQDLWSYQPTVRGAATPFGIGCAGSAGVPSLSAVGAPIVGNRDFGLELGPTAPLASILIGLSCNTIQQPLPGGCELYLPPVTLESTQSNAAGYGRIGTAIPLDASLSGASIAAQGFVLDAQGAFLGLASFSQGLAIRIGD